MKTIIEMAREAGCPLAGIGHMTFSDAQLTAMLERFAELVRADEREACAKVCEGEVGVWPSLGPRHCAAAIRARGNT